VSEKNISVAAGAAPLLKFAQAVVRLAWNGGVDGGDIQGLAEEHGIIVPATYDPAIHGEIDEGEFDPGDEILVFADWVKALAKAQP
jgi:hypothetical protein